MQLKVKLLKGGREETVEVNGGAVRVLDLKKILQEVFMIPAAQQSLVFRGKALLDARNIASYGIKDGTKLFLTQRAPAGAASTDGGGGGEEEAMETDSGRMSLTVKLLRAGRDETIEVDSDQVTVAAVKKIIEVKCNVPSNQQSIVVGGKALQDSRKLSDCGIKNGDTLYLAQKSPPTPPPLTRPLPSWSQCSQFHSRTQAYLSQHFTEDEAEQIVTTMERDLRQMVHEVNLDSVEALAARTVQKQKPTAT